MNKTFIISKLSITLLSALLFFPSLTTAEFKSQSTPETINEEVEKNTDYLLVKVINKAKSLQEHYGDFSPFGAGLLPSGDVKYIWYAKPGQVVQDPEKALPLIRSALSSQANNNILLGSAVVYKYDSGEAQKQINVEVEYATGFAMVVGSEFNIDENNKVTIGSSVKKPYKPSRIFLKGKEKNQ